MNNNNNNSNNKEFYLETDLITKINNNIELFIKLNISEIF